MDKLNDKEIIREISGELDIASSLVEDVISGFFSDVAKTIATNQEFVIEVKHLGKFQTKKTAKHGTTK